MHATCFMANKPKFLNQLCTTMVVFVLSTLLLTNARNLVENTNSNVHPKDIFILAGQSNMAGRGGYYNKIVWTPEEDKPDPERIFRLNAQLSWEVAKDPLHYDIENKTESAVGPGLSFANAIKERVGSTIGLVPCAVGNTGISQWQRGCELYNNMTKRAKAAVEGGGEIKALLWYQGEYDSTYMDLVNNYKGQMESLIQNIPEDLNLPALPVIQVAIATGGNNKSCYPCIDKLRTIQKSINLSNVVTIDAKGLPNNGPGDEVHLNREAQVTVGHMMAKVYLENFLVPTPSL